MSKDKSQEKAREYVPQKLKENGYRNFHGTECVECAYISGYTQSVTDLSTENAQLREALRELVNSIDDYTYYSETSTIEEEQSDINLSDALYKAKQLLTDKE